MTLHLINSVSDLKTHDKCLEWLRQRYMVYWLTEAIDVTKNVPSRETSLRSVTALPSDLNWIRISIFLHQITEVST